MWVGAGVEEACGAGRPDETGAGDETDATGIRVAREDAAGAEIKGRGGGVATVVGVESDADAAAGGADETIGATTGGGGTVAAFERTVGVVDGTVGPAPAPLLDFDRIPLEHGAVLQEPVDGDEHEDVGPQGFAFFPPEHQNFQNNSPTRTRTTITISPIMTTAAIIPAEYPPHPVVVVVVVVTATGAPTSRPFASVHSRSV